MADEVLFVQAEDETESPVRTWGGSHSALWAALAAAGRAVEVVVVGRDRCVWPRPAVCSTSGRRRLPRPWRWPTTTRRRRSSRTAAVASALPLVILPALGPGLPPGFLEADGMPPVPDKARTGRFFGLRVMEFQN